MGLDRDAKWLAWFEQQFSMVAGEDRQIDMDEFKRALHVKKSFFAERFFRLFDRDNSGTISLKELMDGLSLLTNGSELDKLNFLFQVYDVDGNGHIDFDELRLVLKSCMDESALKFSEDKLDELTRALFEDADTDNSGTISFEELQAELDKHPGVVENLTISAANWLKPPSPKKKSVSDIIPAQLKWKYIRNNLRSVIYVVLFVLINIGLFTLGVCLYYESGPWIAIARGGGQCLNFNPVLVIVLMFRRCLTWIRSTRLANFLPLDQHIELHKLTGFAITLFGVIHFIAHAINLVLNPDLLPLRSYFDDDDNNTNSTNPDWVESTAGITGALLLIILVIMVVCSLPFVRRNGYFQVFYWTHLLFVLFYILLILHGRNFWKWFLVPGAIYILERIMRSKWVKLAKYGRTFISEGILLPSRVSHLVLTRPTNFTYQPGDYVFIQIPCIAKYEWHPFTISSAPEQKGFLWLHIRSVGTWTNKLYEFFEYRNMENERRMIAMQLPRDQQVQQTHELEQAVQALEDEGDYYQMCNIVDAHPLAPQQTSFHNDTKVPSHSDVSVASLTHGQNFSHMYKPPNVIHVQMDSDEEKGIEVYIDGPYGTSSTHIFQAEHAVLIGAGIGVTPYASILQSIVMRYRNVRQVCPKCNHCWTGDLSSSIMTLKKVDFFWINRDQKSFEWFVSLLSELEIEQSEHSGFDRFLEMHMYMTSALSKTDMKAIGLQMALDLIHKKEKRDLITGLKTRTQAGRPNWNQVFQKLENERKGKVTIFFCGSPAISKILKAKCSEYNFEFRKENF
ncbi:NADPH oxidase 5-like isoform X2 [Dysidea avara]|uniref:NADPH oxidase 5-like isoform X2 n=1 Tax=Dysidea avara TaxID=196820 RepID=UPI00331C01C0